eukprot:3307189-Alexandrium_andersonii.AAC.1
MLVAWTRCQHRAWTFGRGLDRHCLVSGQNRRLPWPTLGAWHLLVRATRRYKSSRGLMAGWCMVIQQPGRMSSRARRA